MRIQKVQYACGCKPVATWFRCYNCNNREEICKIRFRGNSGKQCPECEPRNGSDNGTSSEGRSTGSGNSSGSSGYRDSRNITISDTKINIARFFAGPAYRKQFDDATGWSDRPRSRRNGGRSKSRSSGGSRRSRSSGSYASTWPRREETDQGAEGTLDSEEHDDEDPGNQPPQPVDPPAQHRPSPNVPGSGPMDPLERSNVDTRLAPVADIPVPDILGQASQPYQLTPGHNLHDSFPGKRGRKPPIGPSVGDYGDRIKPEHSQRHTPPDMEVPLEDKFVKLTVDAPETLPISRSSSSGRLRDPSLSPLKDGSQNLTIDGSESKSLPRPPISGGLRDTAFSVSGPGIPTITLNEDLFGSKQAEKFMQIPSPNSSKYGSGDPRFSSESLSPKKDIYGSLHPSPGRIHGGPIGGQSFSPGTSMHISQNPSPGGIRAVPMRSEDFPPAMSMYGSRTPSPEGVRGVQTGLVLPELLVEPKKPTISMGRRSKWKVAAATPPFPGAWNEDAPLEPRVRAGSVADNPDYYSDKPSGTGSDNNSVDDAVKDRTNDPDPWGDNIASVENGPVSDPPVYDKDDNPW